MIEKTPEKTQYQHVLPIIHDIYYFNIFSIIYAFLPLHLKI